MRIVQIIDSLHVGGAERMAVNYANALADRIAFSGLVATREQGALQSQIEKGVSYLFLDKRRAIDFGAIFKLRAYCKANDVEFVHPHGTSFFMAFLLKLVHPRIKIIWHEHKGARSSECLRQNLFLWFCSHWFSGIIVVDHTLEHWCRTVLKFNNVIYLPNFTLLEDTPVQITTLHGEPGKRVVCLANLRHPKNHLLIVKSAAMLHRQFPDWTFHLIGNDFDDAYSKALKQAINDHSLEETVYIYGLRQDTGSILEQSDIAVLSSLSEGLPVALLEYGMHKKAVVATNVGELPLIIADKQNGRIVPSDDAQQFSDALMNLMGNPQLRKDYGEALYQTILQSHSQEAVVGDYLNWLNKI